MFLSILESNERELFLNLAKYAMGLNGEMKEEEIIVYKSFQNECNLHTYEANDDTKTLNLSISLISKLPREKKNAVFIELFGILLADNEICDAERGFMDQLTKAFDYEDFEVKRIERWVLAMNDLVREGYRLVEK